MSRNCQIKVPAVALLAVMVLGSSAARSQLTCFADWSEAGPIVRREGLAPMELVDRLARDRSAVQILRSTLCREHDRYVYRLTVRGGEGTLRTMFVDARHPFQD